MRRLFHASVFCYRPPSYEISKQGVPYFSFEVSQTEGQHAVMKGAGKLFGAGPVHVQSIDPWPRFPFGAEFQMEFAASDQRRAFSGDPS